MSVVQLIKMCLKEIHFEASKDILCVIMLLVETYFEQGNVYFISFSILLLNKLL